jgi:hypothetical protein
LAVLAPTIEPNAIVQTDSTVMNTNQSADNVDIDPIDVEFLSKKDSLSIDEIFELKVNVYYRPRLLTSVPPDWNGFALKVVLPNGFEQLGGDYYDFVEASLSESNATKTYSIIGKFTNQSDSLPCFKAIRSTIGARNESKFWERQTKCLVLKNEKVAEAAFDPFLTNKELMTQLKGNIGSGKDENKNLRSTFLSLSLISPASAPVYFGYCDEVSMQIGGSMSNMAQLRYLVQYEGSSTWFELSNTEYIINTSTKTLKLIRGNNNFLPTNNFKLKVSNGSYDSDIIHFNLQRLPTLSSSKTVINPVETVTITKETGSNLISSNNIVIAKKSTINNYVTPSPYLLDINFVNSNTTFIPSFMLNDDAFAHLSIENLTSN